MSVLGDFYSIRSVLWSDGAVKLLDQNAIPWELKYVECRSVKDVAKAIRDMTVRGAPAIGVAAAMGIALAAVSSKATSLEEFMKDIERAAQLLASSRPTARNLFWAIERALRAVKRARSVDEAKRLALSEALRMADEDVEVNRRMGDVGADLIDDGDTVLTHCKQLG